MPLVESDALLGLHAERIIEPTLDQIDLHLAILEIQPVPSPSDTSSVRVSYGAGGRSGPDPRGQSELVIEAEFGYVVVDIDFHSSLTIERAAARQSPLDHHAP